MQILYDNFMASVESFFLCWKRSSHYLNQQERHFWEKEKEKWKYLRQISDEFIKKELYYSNLLLGFHTIKILENYINFRVERSFTIQTFLNM